MISAYDSLGRVSIFESPELWKHGVGLGQAPK